MSFSFDDRADQKTRARARDEARLQSGEISHADLQEENFQFSVLRKKGPLRVYLRKRGKPSEFFCLVLNHPREPKPPRE